VGENKMKVAFIVPPGYSVPHAQFNLERLGLCYLASTLRTANYNVEIFDGIIDRLNWVELFNRCVTFRPAILGVSLMSHHGDLQLQEFLSDIRRCLPNIHICLGGVYPSLNWDSLLDLIPEVDSVVCGDGEITTLMLVEALKNNLPLNCIPGLAVRSFEKPVLSPPSPRMDLNNLQFPSRDQLNIILTRNGPASMISSRGCYGRCTFCAIEAVAHSLYPKRLCYRSATNVVDEIEYLYKKYGASRFYFVDENFIGPGIKGRRRAKEISKEIIERKLEVTFSIECRCSDIDEETFRSLSAAGLQRVFLGVESIESYELRLFHKNQSFVEIEHALAILRELGIFVEMGFILFTPWSTLDSLLKKRSFIEKFGANATASLGSYLSIMPGTAIVSALQSEGLLQGEWPSYWFEFKDRRAAILFGMVQRELVEPWDDPLQELLGYQWNRPFDFSVAHALKREPDKSLEFVQELLQWTSKSRLSIFDDLYSIVERLSIPEDVESPPEWALDELKRVSEESRRTAAEVIAFLRAVDHGIKGLRPF